MSFQHLGYIAPEWSDVIDKDCVCKCYKKDTFGHLYVTKPNDNTRERLFIYNSDNVWA